MQRTIAIFGGDARQAYAVRAFLRANWAVRQFQVPEIPGVDQGIAFDSLEETLDTAEVVLGPVPFQGFAPEDVLPYISDEQAFIAGMLPQELRDGLEHAGVSYYDILEREDFAILNAISTAEGAIAEAIGASNSTLHLTPALVLGYGRCAKPLVKKLQGLQAHVTVAARRWEAACTAIADGCEVLDFVNLTFTDIIGYVDVFAVLNYTNRFQYVTRFTKRG